MYPCYVLVFLPESSACKCLNAPCHLMGQAQRVPLPINEWFLEQKPLHNQYLHLNKPTLKAVCSVLNRRMTEKAEHCERVLPKGLWESWLGTMLDMITLWYFLSLFCMLSLVFSPILPHCSCLMLLCQISSLGINKIVSLVLYSIKAFENISQIKLICMTL